MPPTSMPDGQRRTSGLKDLVQRYGMETGILVVAAVLRLATLFDRSLWYDEARTLIVLQQPPGGFLQTLMAVDQSPPLYHLLVYPLTRLFDDPLVPMRLVSVFCGVAAVAAVGRLCRHFEPRLRNLAMAMAALAPAAVQASQGGRAYGLLMLVTVLCYDRFLGLLTGAGRRGRLGYAALVSAGLFTHYYFGFVVLCQALLLCLWNERPRGERLRLLAVQALACVPFALWLPALFRHGAREVSFAPMDLEQLFYCLGSCIADFSYLSMFLDTWIAVFGGFLAVLAALGLWRAVRDGERGLARWGAVALCLPFVAAWTIEILLRRPMTEARYFAVAYAPLYLILASAAAAPRQQLWRRLGEWLALIVIAANLAGRAAVDRVLDPGLAVLAERIRRASGERTPVVHLSNFHYLPMRFYYLPERRHRLLIEPLAGLDWDELPGYPARMAPRELTARRVYVVIDGTRRFSPRQFFLAEGARLKGLLKDP